MGTHYHHLTLEDRCDMARLYAAGRSLRQIAAALDRPPSTVAREMKRNRSHTRATSPAMPSSRPTLAGGAAPGWPATLRCAPRSSPASSRAGPPSRSQAASLATPGAPSSRTKPSTGSSTLRSPGQKPMRGATLCPKPKPPAAAGAHVAAPPPGWLTAAPSSSASPQPPTARPRAIGKPI